jgi:hypothetical protein
MQGYAVDREGHVLNSCCVAVPIFDNQRRIVGSIGISGEAVEPVLYERVAAEGTGVVRPVLNIVVSGPCCVAVYDVRVGRYRGSSFTLAVCNRRSPYGRTSAAW